MYTCVLGFGGCDVDPRPVTEVEPAVRNDPLRVDLRDVPLMALGKSPIYRELVRTSYPFVAFAQACTETVASWKEHHEPGAIVADGAVVRREGRCSDLVDGQFSVGIPRRHQLQDVVETRLVLVVVDLLLGSFEGVDAAKFESVGEERVREHGVVPLEQTMTVRNRTDRRRQLSTVRHVVGDHVESIHAEEIATFVDDLIEKSRRRTCMRIPPCSVEFLMSPFPHLLHLVIRSLNQFLKYIFNGRLASESALR
jgi:hypothetical protein